MLGLALRVSGGKSLGVELAGQAAEGPVLERADGARLLAQGLRHLLHVKACVQAGS